MTGIGDHRLARERCVLPRDLESASGGKAEWQQERKEHCWGEVGGMVKKRWE